MSGPALGDGPLDRRAAADRRPAPSPAEASDGPRLSVVPGTPWRNWGRSVSAEPRFTVRAGSADEVVAAVRFARERGLPVKPIGAGHSFSAAAATNGVRIDLRWLDGVLGSERLPNGNTLVTLGAGTNLYQLPALLSELGVAMQNLGDIDRQTIAGATSTGTHGTGLDFGGIATRIRRATIVTAAGELLRISETEHAELLPAVALAIGSLGVLVEVAIECVPAFGIRAVERREPLEQVLDEWPERAAGSDHFELYTWPYAEWALTKSNTRLASGESVTPLGRAREWFDDAFMANDVYGGLLGLGAAVPAAVPTINRLAARLVSAREFSDASQAVFVSPRTFRFREMEYAVPVEAVPEAVREIRAFIDRKRWRISMPIEVRCAAADELWLSTAHGRATGYIAVHRFAGERLGAYFREVEPILRAHDGRPHWGKMHTRMAADLRPAYPRFDDFLAVRDRLDPDRVFGNEYLRQILGS